MRLSAGVAVGVSVDLFVDVRRRFSGQSVGVFVGVSVDVFVGVAVSVSVSVAVGASVDVSVGDRRFVVGAAVEIDVENCHG